MPANRSRAMGLALLTIISCSPWPNPTLTTPSSYYSTTERLTSRGRPSSPELAATAVDPIDLHVVYPGPTDLVRVRDSSFLFGSVANGSVRLTVNGQPVRVWPNGAWLGWLPFPPESVMQFRITARLDGDSTTILYPVRRDPRYFPGVVSRGSAWVDTMGFSPRGQVWLPRTEYLPLSARAAEGSSVRLQLPGGEILRLLPQRQPEEVLPGIRAFERDTSKLRTPDEVRYVGVVRGHDIGPDPGPIVRGASASFIGVLGKTALQCVTGARCPAPYEQLVSAQGSWAVLEAAHDGDTVRTRWPLQVSMLDTLPIVTQLEDDTAATAASDSITNGRAIPGGTYEWFFPSGTRGSVTGRVNDDIRIRLSPQADAWVPVAEARPVPAGVPAPHAIVGSVTVIPDSDRVTLRVPLTQRVPFQVTEGERTLSVRIYSAAGDVDWMRYQGDSLVRRLTWSQAERDEVLLTVDLSQAVWGYRTRWSRNDLLLEIRRPPQILQKHPFRGRIIAVDPGHPPLGATGPTGLRESDANLAVAVRLRGMLESAGARVVMTRTTDTAVDLWERVARATAGGAELLISIHNNALPDGMNPFTNGGTSVFYNQPRSLALANEVQRALVRRLRLPDLGVSRGDLAMVRTPWMPAILCEGMYVILPDQESLLRSARGQALYARGVFDGIDRFLRGRAARAGSRGVGRPGSEASPRPHPTTSQGAATASVPDSDVAH
jgi:N-acetylmuramoyl-L-alanine amidase